MLGDMAPVPKGIKLAERPMVTKPYEQLKKEANLNNQRGAVRVLSDGVKITKAPPNKQFLSDELKHLKTLYANQAKGSISKKDAAAYNKISDAIKEGLDKDMTVQLARDKSGTLIGAISYRYDDDLKAIAVNSIGSLRK